MLLIIYEFIILFVLIKFARLLLYLQFWLFIFKYLKYYYVLLLLTVETGSREEAFFEYLFSE